MLLSLPIFSLLRLAQGTAASILATVLVYALLLVTGSPLAGSHSTGSLGSLTPQTPLLFWDWFLQLPATEFGLPSERQNLLAWLFDQSAEIGLMVLLILMVTLLGGLAASLLEAYRLLPKAPNEGLRLAELAAGRRAPLGVVGAGLQRGAGWSLQLGRQGLLPLIAWMAAFASLGTSPDSGLGWLLAESIRTQAFEVLASLAVWTAWISIMLRSLLLWLEGLLDPTRRRLTLAWRGAR